MYAYSDRATGKSGRLFGEPLQEVLKTHKVCISGFFLSLLGVTDTTGIAHHYGFTQEQLGAIIHPECEVEFDSFSMYSPSRTATLKEVKSYINKLFSTKEYLKDDFEVLKSIDY